MKSASKLLSILMHLCLMLSLLHVSHSAFATDIISTVAGNGNAGFNGDNQLGTSATVNYAWGVSLDPSGSILIADTNNHRIRKVIPGGNIITIAGNGTAGFSGDNGPATSAMLNGPRGVSADAFGNVYIADTGNNRIRRIDATTGKITTIAGNGQAGFSGDNGLAINAKLNAPTHAMSNGFDCIAIADSSNNRARCVTPDGMIMTLAGNGTAGYGGDGGPGPDALLNYPSHVAWDNSGNLLISDRENHRIRGVNISTGIITTVAGDGTAGSGGDGGLAIGSHLFRPFSVTVDAAGNYFIADSDNNRIRRVSILSGKINTVAGNGQGGFNGDGNNAKAAKLDDPVDVITDQNGTFYIADLNNLRIRGVNSADAPSVNAGTDKYTNVQVLQNATVTNAASLQWRMIAGPAGGQIIFGSPNSEDTTISATLNGVYIVRLVATGVTETVAYDDIVFTWDTTKPVIHSDITQEAVGPNGNVVSFVPATDAIDSNLSITSNHASGETFPLGVTTVNVTATDAAGNSISGSFKITIQDTTPPVISNVPADISMEAANSNGTVVNYAPASASDAVTTNPTITYSKASGTTFPLGTTTVTITATDAANNSSTATFHVTISDGASPVLTVPADMVVEATSPSGAVVNYPPATATDNATQNPTITYSQASGTVFPLGQTIVNVTATDSSGNSAQGSFKITVQDTTPPVIGPGSGSDGTIVNGNLIVEATSAAGAVVNFIGATDLADPNPTVICNPPSGSQFPLGATTVNVTATDASGNSATGSFTITVVDTTPPAITPPPDQVVEATGFTGAVVNYPAASVTDAVTANPVVSYSRASGETFALGTTTINITATDNAGNVGHASFKITVRDTTPPTIGGGNIVNGNLTVEATGPDGAIANFVGATDLADPNPTIVCNPPSGSLFPLGVTTVNVTATDASGNTASGSFTVTVVDTTAPVISNVPADMLVNATDANGAIVNYPPATATDAVSTPVITYSNPSGSQFPMGYTTVVITATDVAGNAATKSFVVRVIDPNGPFVDAGTDKITNVAVLQDATVLRSVVCHWQQMSGPPGGTLTFGSPNAVDTTISANVEGVYVARLTATTADGISSYDEMTFTWDVTPPSITLATSNVTAEATGPNGAIVSYEPATVTDVNPFSVVYSQDSGTQFPLGVTTVTVLATDAAGNSASATFTVTVQDTTPPVLSSDVTAEATGPNGAIVTFVGATDLVDPNPAIIANPASGSLFPLGDTLVAVSATDASGNSVSGTITVYVFDTTKPVFDFVPPDQVVEATITGGAIVEYPPASAHDAVTPNPTITYSNNSGTFFPLGETIVTITATDDAGNECVATFKITVQDTTPPVIGPGGGSDGQIVNGNLVVEATSAAGAIVNFVGATDLADASPTIDANPPSGSQFPIGVTTVNVTATDHSGNSASGSFTITVVDTTPPTFTFIPADITIEATHHDGDNVNYPAATATDLTSTPTINYSNTSGSFFMLGTTVVTITATDAYGNSANATFSVTVTPDHTPPTIVPPSDVTTEATGNGGAVVTYPPADTGDATNVTYDHPSGDFFPVGTTVVTITATDDSGNTSTSTFNVTVQDTTAPLIVSGLTANPSEGTVGVPVVFNIVATDAQPLTYTWDFGDGTTLTTTDGNATHTYDVPGNYSVTVVVSDPSGNKTGAGIVFPVNLAATPENHDVAPPVQRAKVPMVITRLMGGANFVRHGMDRVNVAGLLPNTSTTFTPKDMNFVMNVGGAIVTYKLDAKGRARSSSASMVLKLKYKRNKLTKKREFVGGAIPFTARMKGNFAPPWQTVGVDPTKTVKKGQILVTVDLTVGDTIFTNTPTSRYDSKATKSARFKYIYRKPRK